MGERIKYEKNGKLENKYITREIEKMVEKHLRELYLEISVGYHLELELKEIAEILTATLLRTNYDG